jgi:hypothetical protein
MSAHPFSIPPVHDLAPPQQSLGQLRAPDIVLDELEAGMRERQPQARQIAGIGEGIEDHDDILGVPRQPMMSEVAPDEPGAAGYQEARHR